MKKIFSKTTKIVLKKNKIWYNSIKVNIMKNINKFKLWYKLPNVGIAKFYIGTLVIMFFVACIYISILKINIYKQENQMNNLHDNIVYLNNHIQEQDSMIVFFKDKQEQIKQFITFMFNNKTYTTSLTGYHPVRKQTDSTPDVTADGTKIDVNRAGEYRYVALSRDLIDKWGGDIKFGDFILIKGTPNGKHDGIYQVRDTMNERHTDWIDILLTPGDQSFYYKKVIMYKIDAETYNSIVCEFYDFPKLEPIALIESEI